MHTLDRLHHTVISYGERRHVETIVVEKIDEDATETIKPCILIPHGGPHIAMSIAFSPVVAAFVFEGCMFFSSNYIQICNADIAFACRHRCNDELHGVLRIWGEARYGVDWTVRHAGRERLLWRCPLPRPKGLCETWKRMPLRVWR